MLSRQHGKIRAVAKGVRRTASKFGSRLEPFMVVDVQLYEGRSLDIVTQAESIGAYGADIASDYASYTAATVMVETADKITDDSGSLQQYLLLVGGLRSLSPPRARARAHPRLLSSPLAVDRGLGSEFRRLRRHRGARSALRVRRATRRGRRGCGRPSGSPPARRRHPRAARRPALGRLGDRRGRGGPRARPGQRGWSPRTPSFTSSAGCARCSTSTGPRARRPRPYLSHLRLPLAHRTNGPNPPPRPCGEPGPQDPP